MRHAAVAEPDAGTVAPDMLVRVEDGIVAEVSSDPGGPVCGDEVDGTGLYAVPGLIDCHVHVTACTVDEHALTMRAPSYGDLLLTRHDPPADVTWLADPAKGIVAVVRVGAVAC